MTSPDSSLPRAIDVLGSPEPRPRRRGAGDLAVAVVGAAAVGVAGSAVAVAAYLSGGGAQPEDVLPRSAFAMVKLDLDPAAAQKLAVYRLAKRFPATADKVRDQDAIKDGLLAAAFADVEEVDYEADVAPWIGDRIGLAVVPGSEEPEPIAAVEHTDRARAQELLERLQREDEDLHFAFSALADYVLLGSSQQLVDSAARGEQVLADNGSWRDGMDALDGDQVVTAWADLGGLWEALPPQAREQAAEAYGVETGSGMSGTAVAGVRVGDDHVEVVGRSLDVQSPLPLRSSIGGGTLSGLVQQLPADTVAALAVTDLGAGVAELFETAYGEDDPLGLVSSAEAAGLVLPDDLGSLLGEETLLAWFGGRDAALRSRTDDVDGAYDAAQRLAALLAAGADPQSVLRRVEGGIAVGSTPGALEAIRADDGGLGDSDAFRAAVPDADDAGYLVYVDVARALEGFGADLGEDVANLEPLQSLGLTGSGDESSGSFRLRLTLRPE